MQGVETRVPVGEGVRQAAAAVAVREAAFIRVVTVTAQEEAALAAVLVAVVTGIDGSAGRIVWSPGGTSASVVIAVAVVAMAPASAAGALPAMAALANAVAAGAAARPLCAKPSA